MIYMRLGEKISEMLEIRKMQQKELSERSGVSRSIISELISGKRDTMNTDTLIKLARALNVHPNYFLEENTIGPAVILEHLDRKNVEFVAEEKSAPYIVLSRRAAEAGIEPEQIEKLIDILIESRSAYKPK